jgi:hypothetical protein
MRWATLWATISQTHLVTLLAENVRIGKTLFVRENVFFTFLKRLMSKPLKCRILFAPHDSPLQILGAHHMC